MQQTMFLTGCASGIGRHLASVLYARGHRLVLTDVDAAGLTAAAEAQKWSATERVVLRPLDVRDDAAWRVVIEETMARFGRIDVLMNIAGVLVPRWAEEASAEDVHRTVDVNVKGLMFGTNEAVRIMVPQGAGHIVNIASLAGIVPVPGIAIYSASKHAARAYSIAVAAEVRRHGVYVTAVCPGVVATPMMDLQIPHEEAALTFSADRPITVEEIGEAIVERALVKKPVELMLTVPSAQGVAAKIGNVFPSLGNWVGNKVAARGRKNQNKLKHQTAG